MSSAYFSLYFGAFKNPVQILLLSYRLCSGCTQSELARLVGVSRATIASWEKGKTIPRLSNLDLIFDVCNSFPDAKVREELSALSSSAYDFCASDSSCFYS